MFTTAYKIRNADPSEFPTLASIEMEAGKKFADLDIIDQSLDFTVKPDKFDYGFSIVVDTEDDGIVGFIQLVWIERFLHIEEVSVLPSHQRKGLAAALIAHALDLARQKDALGVTLSTFKDVSWNGPYYEKLGFEAVSSVGLGDDYIEMREEEHEAGLNIAARQIMIYHL